MPLIAPPGYAAVAPFDKEKHAGLGFSTTGSAGFAASLNAIYIACAEFLQASRHYPLVFSFNESQQRYSPMIVTSFTSGSNLFVSDAGEWDGETYIPAYVRRYPFCVAELGSDGTSKPLVCVDESALTGTTEPFFNVDGEAGEAWARTQAFMQEYETARQQTELFAAAMAEQGLFEVFEAQAFGKTGKRYHITDMYRINEKKLQMLSESRLHEFIEKKYMYYIYAHLLSLDNFQRLLDRKAGHHGD